MDEWPKEGLELSRGNGSVRGTQSFVRVMQWCWRHPGMVGLEILWRWVFGSIALALLWTQGTKIFSDVTGGTNQLAVLGLSQLTITDPLETAARLAAAMGLVLPPMLRVLRWMAPLLLVLWLLISTAGRLLLLRRIDRRLHLNVGTLAALQLIRAVALGLSLLLWFSLLQWAGGTAVTRPLAAGGQPQLVEYFTIVIIVTLTLFSAWAIASWALSLAPLVAVERGSGVRESLRAAAGRGAVRLKLIEINLVMGIVKIALIVLAMVLSACPLPFESVMTRDFLTRWTIGVVILYLVASDFFHVARLVAYLELWRAYSASPPAMAETPL